MFYSKVLFFINNYNVNLHTFLKLKMFLIKLDIHRVQVQNILLSDSEFLDFSFISDTGS